MNIPPFAHTDRQEYVSKKRSERWHEIKDTPGVDFKVMNKGKHYEFRGNLSTPEARNLSPEDIALIVDEGCHVAFGGGCVKYYDVFQGWIYTD